MQSWQRALALFQDNQLAAAEQLLVSDAQCGHNPNALNLLGRIYLRTDRAGKALRCYKNALTLAPHQPALLLGLGNALRATGEVQQALEAFNQAIATRLAFTDAHYNAALCQRTLGNTWEALLGFARASRFDPMLFDAAQQAVGLLGELARSDVPLPSAELQRIPDDLPRFSIVICSIDTEKFKNVSDNYRRLIPADKLEIIGIHDARGLTEAYNRGIRASHGDIIIFSHDDIAILNDDFAPRLATHLAEYDAVGVAGTTLLTGPAVFWSGHPHTHGWVAQSEGGRTKFRALTYTLNYKPVSSMQALDGVLIAAKRSLFDRFQFDETVKGFHFYDIDFTYALYRAGCQLAVVPNLRIVHYSEGKFDATWQRASEDFQKRYPELRQAQGISHSYAAELESEAQVQRFYAFLEKLDRELDSRGVTNRN